MKMRSFLAGLCALLLLTASALGEAAPTDALPVLTDVADAPVLTDKGIDLPGGSIHYPEVSGLADSALQQAVNEALLLAGDVENRLNRVALLGSSTVKLNADWQGVITGNVLSVVFSAEGAVTDIGSTHVVSAVNIDLTDGHTITMDDLFIDVAAATAALEEILQYDVAPELSAHLQNSELTPVPDTFGLSAYGLTLYYPIRSLSTLSDRAGNVLLPWSDLRTQLKLGDGTMLRRIGGEAMLTLDAESVALLRDCVSAGTLPFLPVTLGGNMQEAVDAYRLLADPDLYEGGRMVQLEDGAFRNVWLLTDSLSESWDSSVIQGIRVEHGCLYGLVIGETTRAAWVAALGEPNATATLDAEAAELYRLQPGQSDYYQMGEHQLRLHADETGVLASIIIM